MEFLKFCTKCKQDLPLIDFHKGNGSRGVKSRCIECCKLYKKITKEQRKAYYWENREKIRPQYKRYANDNRHLLRERSANYDKTHRAERTAREAFRRAQKLKATPPWLTKEHKKQMEQMYILRDRMTKETGIIHHVDHIIPLINSMVCGLHVPWNLQVIPAKDNLSKGNKV